MFSEPGEEAKIICSHSIQDYTRIFWYQLSAETRMKFLGYMNVNDGYPETGVDVKISGGASKDKNCTLTVEVSLSSSAVYFCAASHHSVSFQHF